MKLFKRSQKAQEIADEVVVTTRLDTAAGNRAAADAVEAKADRLEAAGDRKTAAECRAWAQEARRAADSMEARERR